MDYHEDNEGDDEDIDEMDISNASKKRRFSGSPNITGGESSFELTPNTTYSPCRTRWGRIFNNSSSDKKLPPSKNSSYRNFNKKKIPADNLGQQQRLPTPVFNLPNPCKELHLLQKDQPPPLNYVKRPVSR